MKQVCIDTETGGLDPKVHGLTEVGLVAFDYDPKNPLYCHIIEEQSIRVEFNPLLSYTPYALDMQDRDYNDNSGAVSESQTCSAIFAFLERHLGHWNTEDDYRGKIIAQYAEFDYGFIKALFDRDPAYAEKKLFDVRCSWVCMRHLMRFLCSIGACDCSGDSLKTILTYYNIPRNDTEKEHSALGDARVSVIAYLHMLQDLNNFYGGQKK